MRLLNVHTLKLETFFGEMPPRYAILSHTWEEEELLYADIQDPAASFPTHKRGAQKVLQSCKKAQELVLDYIWVDTCCIDKTSSAELSESINSMFAWYRQAAKCFAYLADIYVPNATSELSIRESRWFTRGWTLQELIAPRQVIFYNHQWLEIGRREPDATNSYSKRFLDILVEATGMPSSLLCRMDAGLCALGGSYGRVNRIIKEHDMRLYYGTCQVCHQADTLPLFLKETFSNAQKMSWAARRVTTRREDQAYCLLGLFGVNMPLLYGEGDLAFIRLQDEIMSNSDDSSLLAFDYFNPPHTPLMPVDPGLLLAPSACYFADSPMRLSRSVRTRTLSQIAVDSKTIGLRMFICPDDGRSKSRLWLGILPSRYQHDLATRPGLLLKSLSDDNTVFSRVLANIVKVQPVEMVIHVKQGSLYGPGKLSHPRPHC
ncbi:Heterokaryon incompatibility protein (HET) domain containing protein [Naviculisporaceae sp. PSN 640]